MIRIHPSVNISNCPMYDFCLMIPLRDFCRGRTGHDSVFVLDDSASRFFAEAAQGMAHFTRRVSKNPNHNSINTVPMRIGVRETCGNFAASRKPEPQ